jgi:hypothetical protein
MDCPDVRQHLADHALGTLPDEDRRAVEAHLRWCAGCRKEVAELAEGAALVGHALPPASPPPLLRERIVRSIAAVSERSTRSRGPIAAALVAAAMAVGAFGWAVATTARAQRLEEAAQTASQRAERFEGVVTELLRDAGEGRVLSGPLEPLPGRRGGGRAIVFDSPGGYDWALIIAGDLAGEDGPYKAVLLGGGRNRVGRLEPSSPGELAVYRYFARDVSRVRTVTVRDAAGRAVLLGTLQPD